MDITERLRLTEDMLRELADIWEVDAIYHVNISIFPKLEQYLEIPLEEYVNSKENTIITKRLKVERAEYDSQEITFHKPQTNVT